MTAAARRWNKSLRLLHRLGGVLSGVGEEPVRAGSDGAGYLAVVRFLPVLGDSEVGVGFLMFWRGMFQASVKRCRVMAVGIVAAWWVDLCVPGGDLHRFTLRGVRGASPADGLSLDLSFAARLKALLRWGSLGLGHLRWLPFSSMKASPSSIEEFGG